MNWRQWAWRYWRDLFHRHRLEEDFDAELQAHLAMEVERRLGQGVSAEEARRLALRDIRSVEFVKESTREVWTWALVRQFGQDVKHALRGLRRTPGFTAVAVLSLALGIG